MYVFQKWLTLKLFSYSLDNAGINTYQSYVFPQPAPQPKEEDSFEALLMKMKAKLNANKSNNATNTTTEAANASPATNGQNSTNNKIWRINGFLGYERNFLRFSFIMNI